MVGELDTISYIIVDWCEGFNRHTLFYGFIFIIACFICYIICIICVILVKVCGNL